MKLAVIGGLFAATIVLVFACKVRIEESSAKAHDIGDASYSCTFTGGLGIETKIEYQSGQFPRQFGRWSNTTQQDMITAASLARDLAEAGVCRFAAN